MMTRLVIVVALALMTGVDSPLFWILVAIYCALGMFGVLRGDFIEKEDS